MAGVMMKRSRRRSIILKVSRLFGAGCSARVIDEQPRQIEHAGHPGDDRDDVQGFDPEVQVLQLPAHAA